MSKRKPNVTMDTIKPSHIEIVNIKTKLRKKEIDLCLLYRICACCSCACNVSLDKSVKTKTALLSQLCFIHFNDKYDNFHTLKKNNHCELNMSITIRTRHQPFINS